MRFDHLKPGDRVIVSGTHEGITMRDERGTVMSALVWAVLVRFDSEFSDDLHCGNDEDGPNTCWYFDQNLAGYIVREEWADDRFPTFEAASETQNISIDTPDVFMVHSHSDNQKEGTSMKFVTAWLHSHDEFTLTHDVFPTEAAAQESAINLAREEPNTTVVVLKVLTKHRSALTVTTEAA